MNTHRLLLIVNAFWAIPIVIIIRFIGKIYLIKMGSFTHTRIGHFATETAEKCVEIKSLSKNCTHWYWLPWLTKNTCNVQWAKMVRRNEVDWKLNID